MTTVTNTKDMTRFYSQKEQDLFRSLGYENLMSIIDIPPNLYSIAAIECFVSDLSGKSVDSLRRCLKAIHNLHPYRLTDEFDSLIELD